MTGLQVSEEASKLFSEIVQRSADGFNVVSRFREVALAGVPQVRERKSKGVADHMRYLSQVIDYSEISFGAKSIDNVIQDYEAKASQMASKYVENAKNTIDAATIVFAHTVLDTASYDYLLCTIMLDPFAWEETVKEKTLSLADYLSHTRSDIVTLLAKGHVKKELKDASLPVKMSKLIDLCSPSFNGMPHQAYTYDHERLKRLDGTRHTIIHKDALYKSIPFEEDDVEFMQKTAVYMGYLIVHKYKVALEYRYDQIEPK